MVRKVIFFNKRYYCATKIPPNQLQEKKARFLGLDHDMTSHTADITLKNFFVYNVTFGQNEGQVRNIKMFRLQL